MVSAEITIACSFSLFLSSFINFALNLLGGRGEHLHFSIVIAYTSLKNIIQREEDLQGGSAVHISEVWLGV